MFNVRPGQFIDYRAAWDFVSELGEIAAQIDQLARTDPERAVRLYESFLAGCYEKAEGLDDSGGSFGPLARVAYRIVAFGRAMSRPVGLPLLSR